MVAAVRLSNITKSFDGFTAVKSAQFSANWGEVHAVLGENGAGKSTLMNFLAGLYLPDEGEIEIDGRITSIAGPAHAKALHIGMVHQHYKLVRSFTVAENVLLANARGGWRSGLNEITAEIRRLCAQIGFSLDPQARVQSISIAEQQRVEVIKVLIGGARILILDEPTSVLTDSEAHSLLQTVRKLAADGACVILVTHKLNEVQRYADRVTVMRGGATVAVADPRAMSVAEIARLAVGEDIAELSRRQTSPGQRRLEVRDLVVARADDLVTVNGLSFHVCASEIYGIAGVGGNGQTELAEVLMAVRRPSAGAILLDGVDVAGGSPRHRREQGVAHIPADRQTYGLAGELSVADNFAIGRISSGRYGSWAWLSAPAMRSDTERAVREFEILGVRSVDGRVSLLSGGNAQKLVIAREFSGGPKVIVAQSPSRGLDVRACAAVHDRLARARDAGCAVLLISEDLDEVLALSDRIGVINRGRIVREFAAPAERQAVGGAMVGHA